MEVFHDPFLTGFLAHQVGNWEVHTPNSSAFSLILNLSLLCSGAIYPEYNFKGEKIQELDDLEKILDVISFSLVPVSNAGEAIFCWLSHNLICQNFISSLASMKDEEIPAAIMRFTFNHFENVFLNPDWWESLKENERISIFNRVLIGMPFEGDQSLARLQDDGMRFVKWKVIKRLTNVEI